MKIRSIILLLCCLVLGFSSCRQNDYSPKPRGYFRINYPSKAYQPFKADAPFTFSYPTYAQIEPFSGKNAQKYWYNLYLRQFNGYLHMTYYDIAHRREYNEMVEDARKLAFKHTIKASAIDQRIISYPQHEVYGIYYAIEGNTASSVQFFLTDSAKHYFRAALYFNERPQYDSIAPVIKFIKTDIDTLIASFRWKN